MLKHSSLYLKGHRQLIKKVLSICIVEFYKQPAEILVKVVDILEIQGKAARIDIGSDISVKFL